MEVIPHTGKVKVLLVDEKDKTAYQQNVTQANATLPPEIDPRLKAQETPSAKALKENGYSVESVTESGNNVLISFGKGKEEKDPCEDAIEGLAETALYNKQKKFPFTELGKTWITWVFNCDRSSIDKENDYIVSTKGIHAEDYFNDKFDGLINSYHQKTGNKVVRADILIKYSPCHCLSREQFDKNKNLISSNKLNNKPCTQVIEELQSKYPSIELHIYYMLPYLRNKSHNTQCVTDGFDKLRSLGINAPIYFLEGGEDINGKPLPPPLNKNSRYRDMMFEYLKSIQTENADIE